MNQPWRIQATTERTLENSFDKAPTALVIALVTCRLTPVGSSLRTADRDHQDTCTRLLGVLKVIHANVV
jgi:hypothetical protein